ncbi:MAG: MAPEG family protein [Hyphomonadaceae bacterium]
MYEHGMIAPVLVLVLWTLIMWLWMYATRIPAMQKAKIDPQEAARTRTLNLPPEVMRVSDNYNHLHEQPTLFYAVAIAAQIASAADSIAIGLAWAYVAIRIVHSLIQATANIVMWRFMIFSLGSLVLSILAVRTTLIVFGYA